MRQVVVKMDLTPLLSTFVIIAMAELGDKTQLTVVTLCSKQRPEIIFLGSFLALLGVGSMSILIGSTITQFLPMFWIRIGSGAAFIIFGIHALIGEEESSFSRGETTFLASFSLVALMELGDKTQLATIALAAKFASPFLVFFGLGLAFLLITLTGVIIGAKLKNLLPRNYTRIGSSIIFIIFGLIFTLGSISGISVFL